VAPFGDNECKGIYEHSAKLAKIRNNKDVTHCFPRRVRKCWNQLHNHLMDASRINSFTIQLKKIFRNKDGSLHGPVLNPISTTCKLTAVELATRAKVHGKRHGDIPPKLKLASKQTSAHLSVRTLVKETQLCAAYLNLKLTKDCLSYAVRSVRFSSVGSKCQVSWLQPCNLHNRTVQYMPVSEQGASQV